MNKFKKWWNRDKIAAEQKMNELSDKLESLRQQFDVTERELKQYQEQEQEIQKFKDSDEPWVDIVGEGADPVRGLQVKLDWNDAFIQYLVDNGITGNDEEQIVQKWLALLYHDLVNRMESETIEKRDQQQHSDFE